jgi:uncharacterized protein YerC
MTCKLAAEKSIQYAWVDTCCIDKSSSAELTEANNSMYRWYERARTCYVFFSDFDPVADVDTAMPRYRWYVILLLRSPLRSVKVYGWMDSSGVDRSG